MPGDDLATIDWKVYARSDRHYVKKFEEETNLNCHILLDVSASMGYGSRGLTKFDYAQCLAASLAYLMNRQRDARRTHRVRREDRRHAPGQRAGRTPACDAASRWSASNSAENERRQADAPAGQLDPQARDGGAASPTCSTTPSRSSRA